MCVRLSSANAKCSNAENLKCTQETERKHLERAEAGRNGGNAEGHGEMQMRGLTAEVAMDAKKSYRVNSSRGLELKPLESPKENANEQHTSWCSKTHLQHQNWQPENRRPRRYGLRPLCGKSLTTAAPRKTRFRCGVGF